MQNVDRTFSLSRADKELLQRSEYGLQVCHSNIIGSSIDFSVSNFRGGEYFATWNYVINWFLGHFHDGVESFFFL